jgi:hypothetical protein
MLVYHVWGVDDLNAPGRERRRCGMNIRDLERNNRTPPQSKKAKSPKE